MQSTRSSGPSRSTRQLHADSDDVPRGHVGHEPERAGRLRPRAGQHRPELLHATRFPMNDDRGREQRRPGGSAVLFPDARRSSTRLLRVTRRSSSVSPPSGTARASRMVPNLRVGQPHRATRRRTSRSRVPEHQHDQGLLGQPDEGGGPPHVEGRVLQHAQPTRRSSSRRRRSGTINFANDTHQPARHAVRLRNAALGVFSSSPRRRSTSRASSSTTTPRATSRTTGR